VVSSWEHGNIPSGSVNGREYFDQLSGNQILNKDPLDGVGLLNKHAILDNQPPFHFMTGLIPLTRSDGSGLWSANSVGSRSNRVSGCSLRNRSRDESVCDHSN
jgi:hypothetical protein